MIAVFELMFELYFKNHKFAGPFGEDNFSQLFPVYIMSYSYASLIPSWANEITPKVKIKKMIILSSLVSGVLYLVFGLLTASVYPNLHANNILQEMLHIKHTSTQARVLIYVFVLVTMAPGIPIYSITIRYNLYNSKVCGFFNAFFWGCVGPFLFAWMLLSAQAFKQLIDWTSMIGGLMANFLLPLIVYIVAHSSSKKDLFEELLPKIQILDPYAEPEEEFIDKNKEYENISVYPRCLKRCHIQLTVIIVVSLISCAILTSMSNILK
eukprot:GHVL01008751.1.p1 GENE.GHVL01008751.1~~GHVL01008751.1.p1  ORF type:complete len:267 (+),score=33.53 GHVL01008751.1:731-1531(+)